MLAHGGGGEMTRRLVEEVLLPELPGQDGSCLRDSSPLGEIPPGARAVFTTDAFVVRPLFFPGGDIGKLAVCGTVNDLACSGARPIALSLAFIIEEGFGIEQLRRIARSAGETAKRCGVPVVCGDTKVVRRGEADGVFIVSSGVGEAAPGVDIAPDSIRAGDAVVVTGPVGDHGTAVMCTREGLTMDLPVTSDCAPLWKLVETLLERGFELHAVRDPTRGGVAATVVELADASGVTFELDERAIPVRREVASACDLLGLDPLTVANEGKLLLVLPAKQAPDAVDAIRSLPEEDAPGRQYASVIGKIAERGKYAAVLRTAFGGKRIIEMPYGEDLPRIC